MSPPPLCPSLSGLLVLLNNISGRGTFGKEEKREEVGGGVRTVAAETRDWRGGPGSGAALKADVEELAACGGRGMAFSQYRRSQRHRCTCEEK